MDLGGGLLFGFFVDFYCVVVSGVDRNGGAIVVVKLCISVMCFVVGTCSGVFWRCYYIIAGGFNFVGVVAGSNAHHNDVTEDFEYCFQFHIV